MATTIGSIGVQIDIKLRAGDTLGPFALALKDSAGVAINLTGCTLEATASLLSDSSAPEIVMSATVTNAVGGLVSLTLDAADTAELTPGPNFYNASSGATYVWRLRMTDSSNVVQTLLFGKLFVAIGVLP